MRSHSKGGICQIAHVPGTSDLTCWARAGDTDSREDTALSDEATADVMVTMAIVEYSVSRVVVLSKVFFVLGSTMTSRF